MEPVWLTAADVTAINAAEVAQTGEPFALVRPELLHSALASPQNRLQYAGVDDILRLGVSLMVALAKNHPFAQGNKRTAFTAFAMFLDLNGYVLDVPDTIPWADKIIDVVLGRLSENDFVVAIDPHVTPIEPD